MRVFRDVLIIVLLLISLVIIPSTASTKPKLSISSSGRIGLDWLRTNGKWIVDSQGNIVILRGVNFIGYSSNPYKLHTEEDYARMASWGFNVVRLPIAWQHIEPQPGVYNSSYFKDTVDKDIRWAKKYGIYIILDMHQWYWSPRFTFFGGRGQGMPVWMVNGYPDSSEGMNQAITDFWLGKGPNGTEANEINPSMQHRYITIWKLVANRYVNEPRVAIYELFNEPYHSNIIGPEQMPNYLYPFYNRLIEAIRVIDPKRIIAYESTGGWDSGRAQKLNYSNLAYTFHYYHTRVYDGNATALREGFMYRYNPIFAWQSKPPTWDIPIFLGEFGAETGSWNPNASQYVIDYRNILDNDVKIGWMWWNYAKSDTYGAALLYADGRERTELTTYLKIKSS